MGDKLNVVVFSGGRGTATICDALKRHPQIALSIVVNTYDDGKSTGALRRFVPGMLGPSDVRKNVSHMMPDAEQSDLALRTIVEHRFPLGCSYQAGSELIGALAAGIPPAREPVLAEAFLNLRVRQTVEIRRWARAFQEYLEQRRAAGDDLPMADCSLGNILFTGAYLVHGRDFNRTVGAFGRFCGVTAQILNITDGTQAVLVGVKEDGQLLADECSIVSAQSAVPIADIFLLPRYLTAAEEQTLRGQTAQQVRAFLAAREIFPPINPAAAAALAEADVIIYGPGTQHSSLFPSYMTAGLGALIAGNQAAEKVFLSNLLPDCEIQGETANSLFCKLTYYLNSKGRTDFACRDLVSVSFLQTAAPNSGRAAGYIECDPNRHPFRKGRVVCGDWQDQQGRHFGSRVVDELINIVNTRLRKKVRSLPYMVSIVVPGLNEQATVREVLHELSLLNLAPLGVAKEIIYVDGGSTDGSWELACSVRDVRAYRCPGQGGRGAALRFGAEQAGGNIIAFFPSDAEYDVRGLAAAIQMVVRSGYQVVFGSRLVKCLDLSQRIREIYEGNSLGYVLSKYGGMLLSIATQLLFNRYVADVFTGVKVFDAPTYRRLRLTRNTADLDTEIVAQAAMQQVFILEIPVDFCPRTRRQGKKITVTDGLKSLWTLLSLALTQPNSLLGRILGRRPAQADPPAARAALPSGNEFDCAPAVLPHRHWPLVGPADPTDLAEAATLPRHSPAPASRREAA